MFIKIAEIEFTEDVFELEQKSILKKIKGDDYEIVYDPDFENNYYLIKDSKS